MIIKQFEDKNLAHYSYAIWSECESKIVLIDPSRDIRPYLEHAAENHADIIGVIETHPHADFISGHLELHLTTGATIYCSSMLGAAFPHQAFDEGAELCFGKIKLKSLNTPGHSPDSISIVLEHEGKDKAVFTGDTLFIGDCGRPDLREKAGNLTAKREELARQMYYSLRNKLCKLTDDTLVYPAHGAGTLCGKSLSNANSSTIGHEKISNWSLQEMSETDFVTKLLTDQPFIPKYFPFDVGVNKTGAQSLKLALANISIGEIIASETDTKRLSSEITIIDTRPVEKFRAGHLPNSINVMEDGKFETWLGSLIYPEEAFYIAAENEHILHRLLLRIAKIGYEPFIAEAFVLNYGNLKSEKIDTNYFRNHQQDFTIVDIRNTGEYENHPIFTDALHIPLPELRERGSEIPLDKPVMVHCAGGYRSAAGSSLLGKILPEDTLIYDLGMAIKDFNN